MNKVFLLLGAFWLLLGLAAYLTQLGMGVLLMTGAMGGIFLVLGFAGNEQP